MSWMFVIGEDGLACELGKSLVIQIKGWTVPQEPIDTRGVTKLRTNLGRYRSLTRVHPVLCIADTDGQCAVEMRRRLFPHVDPDFLFRLAVAETESWVLADSAAFARFLGIPSNRISRSPDELPDAKQHLLNLAQGARSRMSRELVSSEQAHRPGVGYNAHLRAFVSTQWSAQRASQNSPSLLRAIKRLRGVTVPAQL